MSALNTGAAVLLAALIWMAHPAGAGARDLIAILELSAIYFVAAHGSSRRAVLTVFAAIACWLWIVEIPKRSRHTEASLEIRLNPIQTQAFNVIAAPGRLDESLLWLRAMAAGSFLSRDRAKFDGALECIEQTDGACLYSLPDPNPAPAVLVSRHQRESLTPIRGLYDIEGLQQYVAWAGRPEPAGFATKGAAIELRANLAPLDLLLVRRNCDSRWRAFVGDQELKIECDPLGFMVIDAGRAGETEIRLEFMPGLRQRVWPDRAQSTPLPGGDFPRITPGGVLEATQYRLPPFERGATISIFGHHFDPVNSRVLFGNDTAEIVWAGPHQINARLPRDVAAGEVSLVVEAGGRQSYPETIEVAR